MMIKHYLKVAFRNLAKYKVQSIVSILGLAVGFVCFALSTLWIRYEMTYDTFHEGAERIYLVRAHYAHEPGKISNSTPYPLADYLQKGNPEIEAMASTSVQKVKFRVKDTEKDVVSATADSVLMNFFNIRVLRGTVNFLKGTNGEIAITEEFSKSGNFAIDALLNYKNRIAESKNIKIKLEQRIPTTLPYKASDLCIILGNLLDNAIEASENCANKEIDVYIVYAKNRLKISTKNYYEGEINKDKEGNFLSKKKDKENHGIGLKSVKKIVSLYNGYIEIQAENSLFKVNILL